MENNALSYRRGFDISILSLLVSNIFTIYYASIYNLSLMEVMLVYLAQTLIIGIMNVVRIANLPDAPPEAYLENTSSVQFKRSTNGRKALIFALHFGVFLAAYTTYLIPDITLPLLKVIAIPSLVFFVNHAFSYFYNKGQDSRVERVGVLMFLPYLRLLPMHIVLLMAQATGGLAITFLFLKTIVDIATHILEHAFLRRNKQSLPL